MNKNIITIIFLIIVILYILYLFRKRLFQNKSKEPFYQTTSVTQPIEFQKFKSFKMPSDLIVILYNSLNVDQRTGHYFTYGDNGEYTMEKIEEKISINSIQRVEIILDNYVKIYSEDNFSGNVKLYEDNQEKIYITGEDSRGRSATFNEVRSIQVPDGLIAILFEEIDGKKKNYTFTPGDYTNQEMIAIGIIDTSNIKSILVRRHTNINMIYNPFFRTQVCDNNNCDQTIINNIDPLCSQRNVITNCTSISIRKTSSGETNNIIHECIHAVDEEGNKCYYEDGVCKESNNICNVCEMNYDSSEELRPNNCDASDYTFPKMHPGGNDITIHNYPQLSTTMSPRNINTTTQSSVSSAKQGLSQNDDKIIHQYIELTITTTDDTQYKQIKGKYIYTNQLNKGRPIYQHMKFRNIIISYDSFIMDGNVKYVWSIKNKEDRNNTYIEIDSKSLTLPVGNWNSLITIEEIRATDLPTYFILSQNKYIQPKIDIATKIYHLQQSDKSFNQEELKKIYSFNFIKEYNYYYIKNELFSDKYLNIDNLGNIIISKEKSKFELVKIDDKYAIKSDTNKLMTLKRNKLSMENSINMGSPNENQLFKIGKMNSSNGSNGSTNSPNNGHLKYGYYSKESNPTTTIDTSESDKKITFKNSIKELENELIMCNKNEYLTRLSSDSVDNIELTGYCSEINNTDNIDNLNNLRTQYFEMQTEKFDHSHDFVYGDKLHEAASTENSIENSTKILNKDTDNSKLELYDTEANEYLNSKTEYGPIQKIFLTMLILRLNGIQKVNIDTKSLFKYFKSQENIDVVYDNLMETLGPTTTGQTIGPMTTGQTTGPTTIPDKL